MTLYLVLAVLYGAVIPIFESPDAGGHYAYIHELTEGRGLPVQGRPSGERVTGYVASHPPLYYLLSAALTFWIDDVDFHQWAWRNPYHANGFPGSVGNKNFLIHTDAEAFPWRGTPLTVHLARLVSALLGAVAVVGTYGTASELVGREEIGRRSYIPLGAAALTAFTPMFIFTGARVSNDAAVAAFGALTIWGATRLAVRGLSRRGLLLLGAALGLAALSKLSGVLLAPPVALALLFEAYRSTQGDNQRPSLLPSHPRSFLRHLVVNGLILFTTTALLCGWWFVRNGILYGELMGVDAWLSHTATVRPEPIGILEVIPQLEGLEMSYWAMFGWFNIPVSPWMYRVWWALVRLAVVGLLFVLIDQWTRRRLSRGRQAGLVVVLVSFLLILGSVYRFIMIVLGAQGRYLFPAIAASSTLIVLGLTRLMGQRGSLGRKVVPTLLGGAHLVAAVISLFLFILPAYAQPQPVEEADLPEDMTRFNVTVAGTPIQLIGGWIGVEEARPGDQVPVSIYWQARSRPTTNYVTHLRLLGWDRERIGGVDGYPGSGTFPTSLWEPGVIYRDQYLLPLDEGAEAPVLMGLQTGMRLQGRDPLTLTLPTGEPWPGTLLLDVAPLRPLEQPSAQITYPVYATVGERILLIGVDLAEAQVRAGEAIAITLVWQAEEEVEDDYTVFIHLMDEQRELVAQADAPPLDGFYPTSWWAPGEVVRDLHGLSLPSDLPAGHYTLQVGLYTPTGRLTAVDAEGNRFPHDAIPVTTLEVR